MRGRARRARGKTREANLAAKRAQDRAKDDRIAEQSRANGEEEA